MNTVPAQRARATPLTPAHRMRAAPPGQPISPEVIDEFLTYFSSSGRSDHTVNLYRLYLKRLWKWLPEDKTIYVDTITAWRQVLLQSMAAQTAEIHVNAANSLLGYLGRRDLQAPLVKIEAGIQPELTRSEYLRLLSAAKLNGQERTYLLVKALGTLGLNVGELKDLTVEAVEEGVLTLANGQRVYIPKCFQAELKDYGQKNGIQTGPVFITAGGQPLNRSNIWKSIVDLSRDARVDEEKCNPRCLQRMCRQTKDTIRQNLELLGNQMYDRLLEKEQSTVGWETG